MIVSVVIFQVVRGRPVELLWTETLMIVLAHYFTSRRFVRLPPEVIQQLEREGHLETETNPLFLPRHTIRAAIVVAFVGLGLYVYRQGRILDPEPLSILITVFAYLVGVIGRGLLDWWNLKRGRQTWRWWEDFKAVAVLLALGVTATAYILGMAENLPQRLPLAALGLVLFYFGSR